MKNFYHYALAMLYLKIARFNRENDSWWKWMELSVVEMSKVKNG